VLGLKLIVVLLPMVMNDFIVIGNNYSDLFIGCSGDPGVFQAAYLYIDNISIVEMPTQTVHFDTAVCKGQPGTN
jgi:hypothetical protein